MQAAEEKRRNLRAAATGRGAMQDVPHARAGKRVFPGRIKS